MKDPLNKLESPYDVLNLNSAATESDVENAFLRVIKEGVDYERANTAKSILKNYLHKAELDVFNYHPRFSKGLKPSPISSPLSLVPPQRGDAGEKWRREFTDKFPDMGYAHCLAVFWFWWAVTQEAALIHQLSASLLKTEQVKSLINIKYSRKQPALQTMISNVVNYWAMFLADQELWMRDFKLGTDYSAALRNSVIERLEKWFSEAPLRWLKVGKLEGDPEPTQRQKQIYASSVLEAFSNASTEFKRELQLAELFKEVKLNFNGKPIRCGRSILTQVKCIDDVREKVRKAVDDHPSNQPLRRLLQALSSHVNIIKYIERKEGEKALAVINELPEDEQQTEEISDFKTRALLLMASKYSASGEFAEAIAKWKEALSAGHSEYAKRETSAQLAVEAEKMQEKITGADLNSLIEIMAHAKTLVNDQNLCRALGRLYAGRGGALFEEVEGRLKSNSGTPKKLLSDIEQATVDLKEAVQLGMSSAAEPLARAKRLKKHAELGLVGIPKKTQEKLRNAYKAIEKRDFKKAVKFFNEVLSELGNNAPDILRTKLAWVHIHRADDVFEKIKKQMNVNDELAVLISASSQSAQEAANVLHSAMRYLDEAQQCDKSLGAVIQKRRERFKDYISEIYKAVGNRKAVPDSVVERAFQSIFSGNVSLAISMLFRLVFISSMFMLLVIMVVRGGMIYIPLALPLVLFGRKLLQ